jgi:hypothetical protein
MAVAGGIRLNQGGKILRSLVGIVGSIGQLDLAHAGDFSGGGGDRSATATGDQHMDFAADLLRGGNGVEGNRLQRGVVVVCDNK